MRQANKYLKRRANRLASTAERLDRVATLSAVTDADKSRNDNETTKKRQQNDNRPLGGVA
jgi:hypothetical protein